MKVGDRVTLLGIPAGLPEGDHDLPTAEIFQRCVNHTFEIVGFNEIGWAELDIFPMTNSVGESIWVETALLKQLG